MQLCKKIGISETNIIPTKDTIKKLTTFIPCESAHKLKDEIFKTGAGSIGKYENCSFSFEGVGTFKGNKESKPTIGKKLRTDQNDLCVNITFLKHLEEKF